MKKKEPQLTVCAGVFAMATLVFCGFRQARGQEAVGKVIAVDSSRGPYSLVLEVGRGLVPGKRVFLESGAAVVVGEMLSQEKGLFYYLASVGRETGVKPGESVFLEEGEVPAREVPVYGPPAKRSWTKYVQGEWSVYASKRQGRVTAVQGDRALMDRGSIHEVLQRDLYAVYDSSGRYKGKLELKGVGDFQSVGKLYNSLEDFRREALKAAPGDRVVFLGQRKLFGISLLAGIHEPQRVLGNKEVSLAAGLLWILTFPDGWGAEVFFSYFKRNVDTGDFFSRDGQISTSSQYFLPVWVRKSFFYPFFISPFVGLGVSYFSAKNQFNRTGLPNTEGTTSGGIAPVLGGGVEFFPGRFFHPRFQVMYFHSPEVESNGNIYKSRSLFYTIGLTTAW